MLMARTIAENDGESSLFSLGKSLVESLRWISNYNCKIELILHCENCATCHHRCLWMCLFTSCILVIINLNSNCMLSLFDYCVVYCVYIGYPSLSLSLSLIDILFSIVAYNSCNSESMTKMTAYDCWFWFGVFMCVWVYLIIILINNIIK